MKKPLGFFQSIEIPINAGAGTQVKIGDQPQLRIQKDQRIYVQGIEVYTDVVAPLTPSGATNAPVAELQKASFCFYIKGEERIFRLPLLALVAINDLTNPYRFELPEFADVEIEWAKSYIQFATAPVPPYSIFIGVQYSRVLTNQL
jgi:hypothetical protein